MCVNLCIVMFIHVRENWAQNPGKLGAKMGDFGKIGRKNGKIGRKNGKIGRKNGKIGRKYNFIFRL